MEPPPPHPNLPDESIGPNVLIAGWVQAGVATIIVALRVFAGIKVIRKLDWSDYLMVVALIYAGFLQGAFNCFTDVVVTALPIVILSNLNMKLRIKLALGFLMCMSVFAFVAAVIKTTLLPTVGSKGDFTHDVATFAIWFTIENYITIIAASVPTIRPLFLSWRKTTNNSSSYQMNAYGRKQGYVHYGNERSAAYGKRSNNDTIDKYTANISVKASDADASSEENILPMQNYTKDITKTTRVDVRYEDVEGQAYPSRSQMSPNSYMGDHMEPRAL
ncbi:MAG: hypothetical protein Q9227_006512 [Pyrenula ochraceoflavens]